MRYLVFCMMITVCLYGECIWHEQVTLAGDARLFRTAGGYFDLRIDGLKNMGREGEPKLPYLQKKIALPGVYDVQSVEVTKTWRPAERLADNVKLVPFATFFPISSGKAPQYLPDLLIYNSDKFFPEFPVRWTAGTDGETTFVFLNIPVARYNPVRGKYSLMSSATISVYGERIPEGKSKGILFAEENIILTGESLYDAAESLAMLHSEWGVSTRIITIEEIIDSYYPAPYPSLRGFPNETPETFTITANTEYSQRIISFLRDNLSHPSLQSITILGTAEIIPPSFYFKDNTNPIYGETESFVPTDFFYSSPDYDWVPNYAVGRIPVGDVSSAIFAISKLRNWHNAATSELFSRVLLAGGRPFEDIFHGEHISTAICRDGFVSNAYVKKLYGSRGEFNVPDFDEQFRQNFGFVFVYGHGSGISISMDDGDSWTIWHVEALPARDFTPSLFMGSCLNGIYDTRLISYWIDVPFCETFAISPGGIVAFWGASRISYGAPDYIFIGPELFVSDLSIMPLMGYSFINALAVYRPTNFGEWDMSMRELFVSSADMEYWLEQRTLLEYIFFGDPVLPLPEYTGAGFSEAAGFDYDPPSCVNADLFSLYLTDGDSLRWLSLASQNVYKIAMHYPKPISSSISDGHLLPGEEFILAIPPGGMMFCISTDAEDATESRYYFYASPGKISVDGCIEDWQVRDIDHVANDGSDFSPSWLDVRKLYITDDEDYLYVGFTTGGIGEWESMTRERRFTVAIDFKSGGWTGTLGDRTPENTYVCFGGGNAPDYIVSLKWFYGFPMSELSSFRWDTLYYRWLEAPDPWGSGVLGQYMPTWYSGFGFCEFGVPRSIIGNPPNAKIVAYSSIVGESPAQDCVPSDPATYHVLTTGAGYANCITSYYLYHFATNVDETSELLPASFDINISPNPFNSFCAIEFSGVSEDARVKIFNISGRLIEDINISEKAHKFIWDANDEPSGIYIISVSTQNGSVVRKAILMR